MKRFSMISMVAAFACSMLFVADFSFAADLKIATVNVQEVLGSSKAGMEAQGLLRSKAADLQKNLQGDQEALAQLQNQIEMKSSVWSQEVRDEKQRGYQRQMQSLQMRSEDAKYELRQLEKKMMEPILISLNEVLEEVGRKNGYTLVLADEGKGLSSRVGLLYADKSLDITSRIVKELDTKTKK